MRAESTSDGVHGVEMMFACLGSGCKTVSRTAAEDVDVCVGTWQDGRVGLFRGSRTSSSYGGTVFYAGRKAPAAIGNSDGGCKQIVAGNVGCDAMITTSTLNGVLNHCWIALQMLAVQKVCWMHRSSSFGLGRHRSPLVKRWRFTVRQRHSS